MFEKFFPDIIVKGIQDINLDRLKELKIKGLILDIDNTLVPPHIKEPDDNAVKWIESIRNAGFKVCIVSNATKKRVVRFNQKLQVYAIHRASKPGTGAFKKASKLMGLMGCETAVVGDQIFTDIYGGNRADMYTILVTPIARKEFFFVRLKRFPEKLVFRSYRKQLQKSGDKA